MLKRPIQKTLTPYLVVHVAFWNVHVEDIGVYITCPICGRENFIPRSDLTDEEFDAFWHYCMTGELLFDLPSLTCKYCSAMLVFY